MLHWFTILLALSGAVSAASVNLAWDPVADSRLTGYELGWGSATGAYSQYQPSAAATATLDLAEPGPWHIAVRALGNESGESIQSGWSDAILWQATQATRPLDQVGLWARYKVQAPMAITATSVTASHSATDGTSYNTASVSPTSNRLLLLALNVSFMGAHASGAWPSITPSGLGLTWTEVERHLFYAAGSDYYNSLIVFRAVGTVTPGAINLAFGQTVDTVAWDLIEFTDTDTGGTNGANAIVQSVGANGGEYTSSATLAAFSSTDNATFGLVGIAGATAYSPGTGFTELSDHGIEYASQTVIFRDDNSTSVSASHDSTSNSAAIGIEIKAAGSEPSLSIPVAQYYYLQQ